MTDDRDDAKTDEKRPKAGTGQETPNTDEDPSAGIESVPRAGGYKDRDPKTEMPVVPSEPATDDDEEEED